RFGFVAAGAGVASVLAQVRSPYAPSQPAAQAGLRVLRAAPDLVRPLAAAVREAKKEVLHAAREAGLLARPTHPDAPHLMLPPATGDLGASLAARGVRVTRGTPFALTPPPPSAHAP